MFKKEISEERIQCVATDLDFTLLNNKRDLYPVDIAVLKELRANGIPFTFVTGRPPVWAKRFVRLVELDTPFSSSNGGCIFDPVSGQPLKVNAIDPDLCAHVIEYAVSKGIPMAVHAISGLHFTKGNPRIEVFRSYNRQIDDPRDYVMPDFLPEKGFAYEGVFKISAHNAKGCDVKKIIGPMLEEAGLLVEYSESTLLDITTKDSTKADGIRALAEILGFDLKHTIAFGDNHNDISMLKCVGHPVAVANAIPEVKSIAEYVTLSNEEHGVAHALKHFYKLVP